MIITFSISNFRSFADEQTISFVASRRNDAEHPTHAVKLPGREESVLITSAIYGPNGAGKSNLVRAINWLKEIATEPSDGSPPLNADKFLLGNLNNSPTTCDIQFLVDGRIYHYGVKTSNNSVMEEWLLRQDKSRRKVIFERYVDQSGEVHVDLTGKNDPRLESLAVVGGPKHQTFLSFVANSLDEKYYSSDIKRAINWFERKLVIISPASSYVALGPRLANDQKFRQFASNFIKSASTGVENIVVEKRELSQSEVDDLLSKEHQSKILSATVDDEGEFLVKSNAVGTGIVFEKSDKSSFFEINIKSEHKTSDNRVINFELEEESDGTRRLMHLLPAISQVNTSGAVFFIDEIERSLHPSLVWRFVEFFLKNCPNNNGQLIFTTHETNLLDISLLRRDEIWFVEKEKNGSTHLHSLIDFKPRKDSDLSKSYLQGRFGATPFLENIDKLIEGC